MKSASKLYISIIVLISVIGIVPQSVNAQEEEQVLGKHRERIEVMRTAFVTRKTNLTRAESAAFWPIYNEHREATMRLNKNKGYNIEDHTRLESLSDAEIEHLLASYLKSREETMQLQIKFLKDIRTVLPARKVLLFLQADRQFNRELLRKAQR
ncbi:MAG: hypothetical protein U1C46_04970 [Bacteroidales bacterium]|nr:hypothetical protein [Bacteroidales bacterium]MDZ4204152.1 hypothetical protein [Bacteroidales bacterium]